MRKGCRVVARVVAITTAFCAVGSAAAQDAKYLPKAVESIKVRDLGWDGRLSLGSSIAMSQNSNVVGRIDGTSFAFGLKLSGGLDYLRGSHEWRNALDLGETFTRTPAISQFVKTNDELRLDSLYLYHLRRLPWVGPFARLELNTALFEGRDVRPEAVDYLVDGAVLNASELRLSDALRPLTLQQTLGVFAKPLGKPAINLELKAGFTARQTIADGQRAIDDNAATPTVEVINLNNFVQGGPSAGLIARGVLSQDRVAYSALAEAMVPVINDTEPGDDRSAAELTNVNFEVNLSFKLVSWASVDYQFRALREPQLLDAWQVQNNLLLTFSLVLFKPEPAPAPPAASAAVTGGALGNAASL